MLRIARLLPLVFEPRLLTADRPVGRRLKKVNHSCVSPHYGLQKKLNSTLPGRQADSAWFSKEWILFRCAAASFAAEMPGCTIQHSRFVRWSSYALNNRSSILPAYGNSG